MNPASTSLGALSRNADLAGTGFAVGYDSPSQFSREYRRMFGAPPSRDALTLRPTAPAAASLNTAEAGDLACRAPAT